MSDGNGGFPDGDWRATPVSMTNGASDTHTINLAIGSILVGIRNGRYEKRVSLVRDTFGRTVEQATREGYPDPIAKAKEAIRPLKEGLPGFCGSGIFKTRKDTGLVEHSGILVVDVDNFSTVEALQQMRHLVENDPHIQAAFVSPSGTGLKALIRIRADRDSHRRSFLAAQRHFRERYSVEIDNCGDLSRLCFVSHDPDTFVRGEEAVILEPLPPTPPEQANATSSGETGGAVAEYTEDDAGNAELFVNSYGNDLRYVHALNSWLIFRRRWMRDTNETIWRIAEDFRKALIEAARKAKDRRVEDAAIRRAQSLGKIRVMQNMLKLAQTKERILLDITDIDANSWLIGARNAVIDLRTGVAREYSRDCYVTKSLACDFKPDVQCPMWKKFFEEVFPDEAVRRFVWKALGYSLTGITGEKAFFFLHGAGYNGKTVLIETIFKIMGDYAKKAADAIIQMDLHGHEPQLAKAEIFGVRFLSGSEIKEDTKLNEKLLKDITGGDSISGRFLYARSFDFSPMAKLWLYGNHDPAIKGTDEGIWGRVKKVPFVRQFVGGKADKRLGQTLLQESSGILNWLIEGCLLWQKEGLDDPEAVKAAVDQYRQDQDEIGRFLKEKTRNNPNQGVHHQNMFRAYTVWADEQGMKFKITSRTLAKHLRERCSREGWEETEDPHNKSPIWKGVEWVAAP